MDFVYVSGRENLCKGFLGGTRVYLDVGSSEMSYSAVGIVLLFGRFVLIQIALNDFLTLLQSI